MFAGLAVLLSGIGIYGVISYTAAQRTREIGVRAALGAPSGALLRMVLTNGMTLADVGLALGLARRAGADAGAGQLAAPASPPAIR